MTPNIVGKGHQSPEVNRRELSYWARSFDRPARTQIIGRVGELTERMVGRSWISDLENVVSCMGLPRWRGKGIRGDTFWRSSAVKSCRWAVAPRGLPSFGLLLISIEAQERRVAVAVVGIQKRSLSSWPWEWRLGEERLH